MIVRWKTIKEDRGSYSVKYIPATDSMFLASLVLTYSEYVSDPTKVICDIESEFNSWIERFPVPLMATACDFKGDGINLDPHKPDRFLTGYKSLSDGVIHRSWDRLKDDEFPEELKSSDYREKVYCDLNAITSEEIEESSRNYKNIVRTGKWIVFLWLVVIPVVIAILGFFNMYYVGFLALLYSFYKARRKHLELSGRLEKSEAQKKKDEEELAMRHHHYHCKLNPEGFIKLRNENFRKEEIASIKREAEELKQKKT